MTQRGSVDTVRIIPAGSRPPDFPELIQTAITPAAPDQEHRHAVRSSETASGSMTLPDLQERRQNDPERYQNAIRPAAPDQNTGTPPDPRQAVWINDAARIRGNIQDDPERDTVPAGSRPRSHRRHRIRNAGTQSDRYAVPAGSRPDERNTAKKTKKYIFYS